MAQSASKAHLLTNTNFKAEACNNKHISFGTGWKTHRQKMLGWLQSSWRVFFAYFSFLTSNMQHRKRKDETGKKK